MDEGQCCARWRQSSSQAEPRQGEAFQSCLQGGAKAFHGKAGHFAIVNQHGADSHHVLVTKLVQKIGFSLQGGSIILLLGLHSCLLSPKFACDLFPKTLGKVHCRQAAPADFFTELYVRYLHLPQCASLLGHLPLNDWAHGLLLAAPWPRRKAPSRCRSPQVRAVSTRPWSSLCSRNQHARCARECHGSLTPMKASLQTCTNITRLSVYIICVVFSIISMAGHWDLLRLARLEQC